MNLKDIFEVFEFQMTSEKIEQITPEQVKEAYELLSQSYMKYIKQLGNGPDNINDFFSWSSKKLDINIVYFKNIDEVKKVFFFSESEKTGTIIFHDLIDRCIKYETLRLNAKPFVSELIQNEILDLEPDKIIDNSFFRGELTLKFVGKSFFEREYDYNWKPQLETNFEKVSFNTLRIHKDIYDFAEMIKAMNNDQFTLELEECLDAYEHEKFFVCAAGLGSVLEHLLYLTIEKHVPEEEIKTHENSTASEYIGQLRKAPFSINKREVSHLKNIFAYRNSVSHFNKGIFSKEMCDHLLGGIKTSFDKYYL